MGKFITILTFAFFLGSLWVGGYMTLRSVDKAMPGITDAMGKKREEG